MFGTKEAGLFLCPSLPQRDPSAVCSDWHFQSLTKQYRRGKLKAQHYLLWVCPMAAAPVIVLLFSLYPFNLFILAVHAVRTVLLYSNCILSIIKACFPWLLWCWNGTRGPIHICLEVPPTQPHTHPCTHTFMLTAEFLFIYWQWT